MRPFDGKKLFTQVCVRYMLCIKPRELVMNLDPIFFILNNNPIKRFYGQQRKEIEEKTDFKPES